MIAATEQNETHLPCLDFLLPLHTRARIGVLEACHRAVRSGADLARAVEGRSAAWVRQAYEESLAAEQLAEQWVTMGDEELAAVKPDDLADFSIATLAQLYMERDGGGPRYDELLRACLLSDRGSALVDYDWMFADATGYDTIEDDREQLRFMELALAHNLRHSGGGQAVSINGSREIDIRSAGVRWSLRWRPVGDGWLRGNPTFSVELMPVVEFEQKPAARGPGLNLIYEHRLMPRAALHPVLRAGAGILFADREVPPGVTRLNFSLLVGFGLDVDLSGRWQLAPEYRFHHVSNADTGPINPGVNTHTLVLGITLRLPNKRRSDS